MSRINAYTLKPDKSYRFSVRYNILLDKDDNMPHYYEATYSSRKGKTGSIWAFKNFTDTETNETRETQEIKHLGLLHPNFELINTGGKTYKKRINQKTRKSKTRKSKTRKSKTRKNTKNI